MTRPPFDIQRIRVRADGYDADGAYWGAGPDVFIAQVARDRSDATATVSNDQITVRAKTIAEARRKIEAELARQPGASRVHDDALGGNPPRKTTYQIDWRDPVSGKAVTLRITHARDYLSSGNDHVEIESLRPKKAPLPVTETGYRSHFMPPLELMNAGGPVAFVTAWLDQEAKGKAWSKAVTVKAQGDLFAWADARTEVADGKPRKPKRSPKPKDTAADTADVRQARSRPSRRRKTGPDPA
jgi:hypothetical protein